MNTQALETTKTLSNGLLISLLVFIGATSFVATDVYLPSLPQITTVFGISIGQAQATVSVFMISFALSQLTYGPISDVFGRKPLLIIGFAIYLIGSIITLMASSLDILLLGRFIQGIGAGAGMSLARVVIRDRFTAREMVQATSFLALGACATAALSPAIGSFIQQYIGYQGNFAFMCLFAAFMLFFILVYLPETNTYRRQQPLHLGTIGKNYLALIRSKIFSFNALSSGLAMGTLVGGMTILPFLLQEQLHLSAARYGIAVFIISAGLFLGAILNSRLIRYLHPRDVMFVGISLLTLGGLGELALTFAQSPSVTGIVGFMLIATLGMPTLFANGMARAFAPFAKIAGTAGAMYGTLQIVTVSIVSAIIAWIHAQSLLALGILVIVLAIINAGLILQTPKEGEHHATQ